ncbi:NADH-quinone oxidoreductase subunit NuoE [Buchnera aphidicola]|nr:NADH-quinone oxidoreductase subunit NuoE [Buchnera aphidicola]
MYKRENLMCELSKKEIFKIQYVKNKYPYVQASIIEVLKIVQKGHGWISDSLLQEISNILEISSCEIEGIATFYSQIFRKPVGRNIIRYCDSVVCFLNGCNQIKKTLEQILNLKIGHTTQDFRYTLLPTCCLGACDQGPVIMINKDLIYKVKKKIILKILDVYK